MSAKDNGSSRDLLNIEDRSCIYRETFDKGPGGWAVGKNDENGRWHRNIFGYRGDEVPLTWHPSGGANGGFASSESPWYFDDNHGEFSWFYLAIRVANSADIGLAGADLRNAIISITLRGTDLKLYENRLIFWIQGRSGRTGGYYEGKEVLYNWALESQPITAELEDGEWHEVHLCLTTDEDAWSQMGIVKGGHRKKIRVIQSRDAAEGTLDHILSGAHHNFGFLLCDLDSLQLPEGRIDVDTIAIYGARR